VLALVQVALGTGFHLALTAGAARAGAPGGPALRIPRAGS
jgi:hypothetical protein